MNLALRQELMEKIMELQDLLNQTLPVDVKISDETTFAQPQQFQPNWDDAPTAVSATVFIDYRNEQNVSVRCKDVLAVRFRPAPPALKVEVGQIWRYVKSGKLYLVIAVGDMKGDEDEAVCFPDWVDSVTYQCKETRKVYTRTLSSFLGGKFEQVQP